MADHRKIVITNKMNLLRNLRRMDKKLLFDQI